MIGRDRSSDIALQGEIAYLLVQQYVDTKMILSMTENMGTDSDKLPMFIFVVVFNKGSEIYDI